MPRHTEKRKPIPKKIRQKIYAKGNGHCFYCGCETTIKEMRIDHFYPYGLLHIYGDHNPDCKYMLCNLVPACFQCNYYKRMDMIERFRGNLSRLSEILMRQFTVKLAVKYGMVLPNPDIEFYYEKIGYPLPSNPEYEYAKLPGNEFMLKRYQDVE